MCKQNLLFMAYIILELTYGSARLLQNIKTNKLLYSIQKNKKKENNYYN